MLRALGLHFLEQLPGLGCGGGLGVLRDDPLQALAGALVGLVVNVERCAGEQSGGDGLAVRRCCGGGGGAGRGFGGVRGTLSRARVVCGGVRRTLSCGYSGVCGVSRSDR